MSNARSAAAALGYSTCMSIETSGAVLRASFLNSFTATTVMPATMMMGMMALTPITLSSSANEAAERKAMSAVANHPRITRTTPDTRYTALSKPQARSASEVPMATMKVV